MQTIILSSLLGPVLATTALAGSGIRKPAGAASKAWSMPTKRGAMHK
jgi:hypothetical protein